MSWQVYMILCSDNTLYTGISKDVDRRILQHARQRGAKYFRARRPRRIVYLEGGHDRSTASRREAVIKKMVRSEKERLIDSEMNEVILHSD
jgi:putative endonuclease